VKLTLPRIREMKIEQRPIVMITAYDHPAGRLVDEAGVDIVLVGDSAGTNVLGHSSEVPTTMDEMVLLTRSVTRSCRNPLVVADLPFLSYHVSDEEAMRNAGRLIKEGGADAVKLEGAGAIAGRVRAITAGGIPVMGHLGLTPQTATMLGGMRAQGRGWQQAVHLFDQALELQAAGCFALVLECVPAQVAAAITRRVTMPVIGIGSGAGTDGQVLVLHDLLGINPETKRFVRRYAELGDAVREAVATYAADVRARTFPQQEHTYPIAADELSAFDSALRSRSAGAENTLVDW